MGAQNWASQTDCMNMLDFLLTLALKGVQSKLSSSDIGARVFLFRVLEPWKEG